MVYFIFPNLVLWFVSPDSTQNMLEESEVGQTELNLFAALICPVDLGVKQVFANPNDCLIA